MLDAEDQCVVAYMVRALHQQTARSANQYTGGAAEASANEEAV